jgi:hypothetical protein
MKQGRDANDERIAASDTNHGAGTCERSTMVALKITAESTGVSLSFSSKAEQIPREVES